MTLLDIAIDHLDAITHLPGYRYYDRRTASWWLTSTDDLWDLGERLHRGDRNAYLDWCADTDAVDLGTMVGCPNPEARHTGRGAWKRN